MSHAYREWDAAYVLGSLSTAERREFEEHLGACAECRAAVADLAAMPGLLSRVPDSWADEPTDVPESLLPRLVAASRRRRRVRTLGVGLASAAAAAAVTFALAVGGLLEGGDESVEYSLAQVIASPLEADVELTSHEWGTTIELECRYDDDGSYGAPSVYAMWLTDAEGNELELATWSAGPGATTRPTASTKLSASEIRRIDVRVAETGAVLLAVEP